MDSWKYRAKQTYLILMNNTNNIYYIYAWYFTNTNEIFYIGKGKGDRYKYVGTRRNEYFLNIIKKYKDNVNVKKLYENLTETEAWALEKKLINEYWTIGECKANFHVGGCGGNHGNYSVEMRKKLSEYASTRIGDKNSMWKHKYTAEQLKHISDAQLNSKKTYIWTHSERHSQIVSDNAKRLNTDPKYATYREERNKRWTNFARQPKSEEYKKQNRDRQCPHNYICLLNDNIIYETRYRKDLIKFCEEQLHISRTIFFKILNNNWKPKFNKHKHLSSLKIITELNKFGSLSTTPDECKEVE